MSLKDLRGIKGCRKCPGYIARLAREMEDTARNQYRLRDPKWFESWLKAVGIRFAEGLLRDGVTPDLEVIADLRSPPNADPKKWKPDDPVRPEITGAYYGKSIDAPGLESVNPPDIPPGFGLTGFGIRPRGIPGADNPPVPLLGNRKRARRKGKGGK